LIVNDNNGVGSCVVDFRISVRGGNRVGRREGMLSSTGSRN
jgi:hypothetical protein